MTAQTHDEDLPSSPATSTQSPISRGSLLRGAAGVGAGLLGTGLTPASAMRAMTRTTAPADVTTISIWHPYGGTALPNWLKLFKYFNDTHPAIKINPTFAANDLSSNQKLFAAVAAGIPPDVTWVDGPEVSGWGFRNILQPLDKYFTQDKLTADMFYPPCWKEIQYNGHFYALPVTADPNFGFFWNKTIFQKAGIKEAPTTFDQFDKLVHEMTVVKNGRIVQAGLLPWDVYGRANSMVTWGWMFGGSFYDQTANKVTANNPQVVAALEWMAAYAKKYGITNFASFTAPFMNNGFAQDGQIFALGKVAMQPMGPWEIATMKQINPNIQYGISKLPSYKSQTPSSWVGGWCIGIPRGSKNPDAAWQFIKWLCATDDGTLQMGKATDEFPGYKPSSFLHKLDPQLQLFYPILQTTMHQRPVTPAEDYYMGQLAQEVDNALYGKKSAKQALTDCTNNVQAYINKEVLKKG